MSHTFTFLARIFILPTLSLFLHEFSFWFRTLDMTCIAVILVSFAISDECLKEYETFGNKVKEENDFHLKIHVYKCIFSVPTTNISHMRRDWYYQGQPHGQEWTLILRFN